MYQQFINSFAGGRLYLISSLWLFLVFFIIVGIMLIRMSRKHIDYMKGLPLTEDEKL